MRKKNIKQENDIRDPKIFGESNSFADKKSGANIPPTFSEMNECRFHGFQEPERKSDMKQE